MQTLTLSGWGQPHDVLKDVAPDAKHVPYAACGSVQDALGLLRNYANVHTVIGWSMGGQLAVRAVAEEIIKPERLVLIATPYRFVQSKPGDIGMGRTTYEQYRENLLNNSARTMKKSHALVAHDDEKKETVQGYIANASKKLPEYDWHYWLEVLADFDCDAIDFSNFPPTLLLHGARDVVVEAGHSDMFHRKIPNAELVLFDAAGHAPHWHDENRVRELIRRHRV
jgi:pimeloyl-[acyl-carrier protein] methyl ester esterase